MGVSGAAALSKALTHCETLLDLDLCGNGLGAGGLEALLPVLTRMSTLTRLHLGGGNGFGAAGGTLLGSALPNLSALTELNLAWADFGGGGGEGGLQDVLGGMVGLERLLELDLSGCALTPHHVSLLLPSGSSNPIKGEGGGGASCSSGRGGGGGWRSVQRLTLRHCSIDEAGASILAEGLRFASSLQRLDLSNNWLRLSGCEALALALTARDEKDGGEGREAGWGGGGAALKVLDISMNVIPLDAVDVLEGIFKRARAHFFSLCLSLSFYLSLPLTLSLTFLLYPLLLRHTHFTVIFKDIRIWDVTYSCVWHDAFMCVA